MVTTTHLELCCGDLLLGWRCIGRRVGWCRGGVDYCRLINSPYCGLYIVGWVPCVTNLLQRKIIYSDLLHQLSILLTLLRTFTFVAISVTFCSVLRVLHNGKRRTEQRGRTRKEDCPTIGCNKHFEEITYDFCLIKIQSITRLFLHPLIVVIFVYLLEFVSHSARTIASLSDQWDPSCYPDITVYKTCQCLILARMSTRDINFHCTALSQSGQYECNICIPFNFNIYKKSNTWIFQYGNH